MHTLYSLKYRVSIPHIEQLLSNFMIYDLNFTIKSLLLEIKIIALLQSFTKRENKREICMQA